MPAISDNLLHFLGRACKDDPSEQFNIFKKIIEGGLRCGHENMHFGENIISNQIVCFTDIPLSECHQHTAIYGKFSIGFKKSFVKMCGGNPVSYFVDFPCAPETYMPSIAARGIFLYNLKHRVRAFKAIENILNSFPDAALTLPNGEIAFNRQDLSDYVAAETYCLSFYKQTGDLGPARDETSEIDLYYKEREWRIIPSHSAGKIKLITEDGDGLFFLQFSRKDVNVIVVPNEEIRRSAVDYFISLRNSTDPRLKSFGDNIPPVVNYDELNRW